MLIITTISSSARQTALLQNYIENIFPLKKTLGKEVFECVFVSASNHLKVPLERIFSVSSVW